MYYILLILLFGVQSLSAQEFDRGFLEWKAQQQQHDRALLNQDPNHYLARPSTKAQGIVGQKININTADLKQLQQLSGVGEKKAQAILQYREQNGKFKTIADLQNVKGIGPKLLEKNKDRLSI